MMVAMIHSFGASSRTTDNVVSLPRLRTRDNLSEPVCRWRAKVADRLEHLVRLKPGWDGYSAPPVRFENAYFALSLLDNLLPPNGPPPSIVPGAAGDLQLEWHIGSVDIELHVLAPNRVHAWFCVGDDVGQEQDLKANFFLIGSWIQRLLAEVDGVTRSSA